MYKTFNYFVENRFEIFPLVNLANDKKDPDYQNLLTDVVSLDDVEVELYAEEKQLFHFVNRNEDEELLKRAFYLQHILQHELVKLRIDNLSNKYLKPILRSHVEEINPDKNNLIKSNVFEVQRNHIFYSNYAYELCPILEMDNASYWLQSKLCEIILRSNLIFKIQVDPLYEIHQSEYSPMEYKAAVYSKSIHWDDIFNLNKIDHGQFVDDKVWSQLGKITDYLWSPTDTEVTFTCEELPLDKYDDVNIGRYFHAVIDKKNKSIVHCDGAIRVYDKETLNVRKQFHINNSEVTKIGKRIKIFQFDNYDNSGKGLDISFFTGLVCSFYHFNEDVISYMASLSK